MKRLKNTSTSGFTLVELIIVITILAILGTIGFVSFQGYTADARNTKRTSDLSSLQSSLESKRAGTSLSLVGFVDSSTPANITMPFNLAGKSITATGTEYNAGIMNFALLGIGAESFKDPNGGDYSFGAISLKNGQYQLAATLEGETPKALVKGDYKARLTTEQISGVVSARNKAMFQITNPAQLGRVKIGDVFNAYTDAGCSAAATPASATVTKVSSDLTYVTYGVNLANNTICMRITNDETMGLIGDYNTKTPSNDGAVVVDGSGSTLPY